MRGHRGDDLGVEILRDVFQLLGSGAGAFDIAGGQHHLDAGGQQRRARAVSGRSSRRQGTADGARCIIGAPLRQPEQGKAGLRLAAELAGLLVIAFRRVECATQPMDLGLLVISRSVGLAVAFPENTLAGAARLDQRSIPVAVELQDFRSVRQAGAAEGHELRLRIARFSQRQGPFAGAVQRPSRPQEAITMQ